MNQSQLTTIRNAIERRVQAIAHARFPELPELSAANIIAEALVEGRRPKLRPYEQLRKLAVSKIIHDRYSRKFEFEELFEPSAEVELNKQKIAQRALDREKFTMKLNALKERVLTDCKLGKFDTETGAALDEFEAKAEKL